MFYREVSALQALRHDNIVLMYERGRDPHSSRPFLVEEFMAGGALDALIARPQAIPLTLKHRLLLQVSQALRHAHDNGVVHRDVKPSNILLSTDRRLAKLADFGISKLVGVLRGGETLGHLFSPRYAAPEQTQGRGVGPAADYYSLALVSLEMYAHPTRVELGPDEAIACVQSAPTELQQPLSEMLSAVPEVRLAALPAWLHALTTLVEDVPAESLPIIVGPRAVRMMAEAGEVKTAQDVNAAIHLIAEKIPRRPRIRVEVQGNRTTVLVAARPYLIKCSLGDAQGGFTSIEAYDIQRPLPEVLELEMRGAASADIALQFCRPGDVPAGSPPVDRLLQRLRTDHLQHVHRGRTERAQRTTLRLWRDILDLESNLVTREASQLAYTFDGYDQAEDVLVLSVDRSPEALGFVPGTALAVVTDDAPRPLPIGTIKSIAGMQLNIQLRPHVDADAVPDQGHIGRDAVELSVAIRRSRIAIDRIQDRKAINPSLVDYLALQPRNSGSAAPTAPPQGDPKTRILWGHDVALVQGPPGTGKTTLICELIGQILDTDPYARILIVSQSHVAVDNVLESLTSVHPDLGIVRIGRDEKIGAAAKRMRLKDRCQSLAAEVLTSFTAPAGPETAGPRDALDNIEMDLVSEVLALAEPLLAQASSLDHGELRSALERRDVASLCACFGLMDDSEGRSNGDGAEEFRSGVLLIADRPLVFEEFAARLSTLASTRVPEVDSKLAGGVQARIDTDEEILQDYAAALRESPELLAEACVGAASIVAGTCLGVMSHRSIPRQSFDWVILDEAGRATVGEAVVPLVLGKRLVLVGDQKQLPPMIETRLAEALEEGLGVGQEELTKSLFEQMFDAPSGATRVFLDTQYRMHPSIAGFISEQFYDGKLRSGVGERPLDAHLGQHWGPLIWLSTSTLPAHSEQRSGTSYKNPAECRAIVTALKELGEAVRANGEPVSCGVITGYAAQLAEIEAELQRRLPTLSKDLKISVGTVDAFQGREFDVVIYSVTRSNPVGTFGFLKDARRLNVALSRARHSVIVVGDHDFIRRLGHGRAGALFALSQRLQTLGNPALRSARM